jgi:hypothetical protein
MTDEADEPVVALYSAKAAEQWGTVIYSDLSTGKPVELTALDRESKYGWEDKVVVSRAKLKYLAKGHVGSEERKRERERWRA